MITDEQEIDIPLPSVIASNNLSPYHFYYHHDGQATSRDAEDMFAHLKTVFHNSNRRAEALTAYHTLKMKPKDTFTDFIAEFLQLADEAKVSADHRKDDLFSKLPYLLQTSTMGLVGDDGTLEQKCEALSELCKKQASDIARLNVETKNMQQHIDTCSSWAQEELDKISSRLDAAVSAQGDLSAKLNFCLPRIWNKNGACFVEEERRQTALLEDALEELQKEQAAQRILLLRLKIGLTIAYPDHPLSLHRVAQEDEVAPILTTPGVP